MGLATTLKILMKTHQHKQFLILLTGDIGISHQSIHSDSQDIVFADKYSDILTLITTTQFGLIVLDLTLNCSELAAHIKNPLGINCRTPIIALNDQVKSTLRTNQHPVTFDDWLNKPITGEQFNGILRTWKMKSIALDLIHILQSKTNNNQPLTLIIFEKLFKELPSQITLIKNALDDKQYAIALEVAHKLNGTASFCGLEDIRQPTNDMEISLLKQDYSLIDRQFFILQQSIFDFLSHQKNILTILAQ